MPSKNGPLAIVLDFQLVTRDRRFSGASTRTQQEAEQQTRHHDAGPLGWNHFSIPLRKRTFWWPMITVLSPGSVSRPIPSVMESGFSRCTATLEKIFSFFAS